LKCIQIQQIPETYRIQIFLDETGCVLNEKMMRGVTIMVLELEVGEEVSKTDISMDMCGGTRNFQTLRPPTLQFLICVQETFGGQTLPWNFLR
jgi:hypothetical protein